MGKYCRGNGVIAHHGALLKQRAGSDLPFDDVRIVRVRAAR
jgi:hypothetical protein